MFLIFLFFFLIILLNILSTIPFSIAALVLCTVIFKKSWVLFAALGIGLFLDLFLLRPLAQTSLFFVIFVFVIWLYDRKFETQTLTFVFISTFFGSLVYLSIFGYNLVIVQALICAIFAALLFKFLILNYKFLIKLEFEN